MDGKQRSSLGYLWEHHRPAMLALALALAFVLIFGVRLVIFTLYWSDPAHRNHPIEGWMTPGYIAHSYRIDGTMLRDALALTRADFPDGRPTLAQIAEARGVALDDIIAEVEAALIATGARPPEQAE
jgi:hypothetical protein